MRLLPELAFSFEHDDYLYKPVLRRVAGACAGWGGESGEGAGKHSVYWGFARIAGIVAEYRKVVDWFEGLARFFEGLKIIPLMGLCGTPLPLFYGRVNQCDCHFVQYKAVCFQASPATHICDWRRMKCPLQLGKDSRTLGGVLVLGDQPLGEVLVEPPQSGGNAGASLGVVGCKL